MSNPADNRNILTPADIRNSIENITKKIVAKPTTHNRFNFADFTNELRLEQNGIHNLHLVKNVLEGMKVISLHGKGKSREVEWLLTPESGTMYPPRKTVYLTYSQVAKAQKIGDGTFIYTSDDASPIFDVELLFLNIIQDRANLPKTMPSYSYIKAFTVLRQGKVGAFDTYLIRVGRDFLDFIVGGATTVGGATVVTRYLVPSD